MFAHHDGDEAPFAPDLALDPLPFVGVQRHEGCDPCQRHVEVRHRLRNQHQPVVQAVPGQKLPGAVKDAAARRRQEMDVDSILVGQHRIALGIDDLKLVESAGETGDQQRLKAAHEERTPREQGGTSDFALHLSLPGARPERRRR